jgi:hypothetical protein
MVAVLNALSISKGCAAIMYAELRDLNWRKSGVSSLRISATLRPNRRGRRAMFGRGTRLTPTLVNPFLQGPIRS